MRSADASALALEIRVGRGCLGCLESGLSNKPAPCLLLVAALFAVYLPGTYALLLIITTYLTLPYCTGRVCYRRHHSLLLLLPLLLLLLPLLLLPPPPSPPPPPPRRLSLSPWTKQTHSAGLCTNGVAFNRSPSPASAALGGVRRIYLDRKRHTPALSSSSSSSITALRLLFPRTSPALLSLTHRAL